MMRFRLFSVLFLGILLMVAVGCASAPTVTKLSDNQHDIYVRGGVADSRDGLIAKWQEAAKETCKGNYEVIEGPKTIV